MTATTSKLGTDVLTDTFKGDNAKLIDAIEALLDLDAQGALVPHGVGGHARKMLASAAVRLARQPAAIDKQDQIEIFRSNLQRTREQWEKCEPEAMSKMSQAAVFHALNDAKRDVLMMHALLAAPLANEASKPAASHIDTTDCEDCGTLGVSVGANCPRCGRLIAAPSVEQDERRANTFTKIGDSLTLTGAQLLEAFEFIAPDHPNDPDQLESEVTIQRGEGHSGDGFYCWVTDYPEEGAILLDGSATPRAASTSANVAQGAEAVEDVPEGCTPADAQVLRAANHALANENDKLRHALAPFARLVSTHTLSWAMVEYCVKGDPEKQTFRHPQMQRAFNRAAAAYSNTAPPVQTALTDDARDATRYRWIRDQGSSLETRQRDKGVINGPSCYHEVEGIRELKWGDSLDEAIDAALTAAQSASGETK